MRCQLPIILAALTFSLNACEDQANPVSQALETGSFDLTLAEYKAGKSEDRLTFVTSYMSKRSLDESDIEHYISCMGDFAANKSERLLFKDVFGWCEKESELSREAFVSHFNELDAEDLRSMASVHCQNLITDQLSDPASADFPFLDKSYFSRGEQRYVVRSYVDAKNAFGGQVRLNWHCDMQYDGQGETADPRNWTLHDLEISR